VGAERLGIVILAYGSSAEHAPLVEWLLAQGLDPETILVVHNPAEPGESAPPSADCPVLESGQNLGYAGGMNLGVEAQRKRGVEEILLLTHDVRLRQGALDEMLAAADRSPAFGVLGPALVFTGTDIPFSFGGLTSDNGVNKHIKSPPGGLGPVLSCDWVDGGAMLVRRAVFDAVGGFDERFWGYCEEADLCLRAKRAGFGVGVASAALAEQEPGATKRPGAWAYLTTRNGLEYARRAVGVRGVAAICAISVRDIVIDLARSLVRGLRLRPGSPSPTLSMAMGAARGIHDYFRGRWGPPPSNLPGMGDLHNA
jgi:N-acetylglucosaminyl-diphospho-decaprenol L-rhamnosyltransferase